MADEPDPLPPAAPDLAATPPTPSELALDPNRNAPAKRRPSPRGRAIGGGLARMVLERDVA